MHFRESASALLLLLLPCIVNAESWTSPDGFLSVSPPDESRFQAIPSPRSPFVGLWVSQDESLRLGVIKMAIPPNVRLVQSSAEEGLAEEIGAKVTRLPTKRVAGYEVWNMTAKGSSAEITQAMVRHNGVVYKVMAATVGGNPDTATIQSFIDSLSIAQPAGQTANGAVRESGGGLDLHTLSKAIGGAGALLAIGLLVYLLTRGKKTHRA